MLKDQHVSAVINRWRSAFEAANGRPAPFVKRWSPGWYYFSDQGPFRKVRLAQLEKMSELLESRESALTPHTSPASATQAQQEPYPKS